MQRFAGAVLVAAACLFGCESGMQRIDRHINELLTETTGELDGDAIPPSREGTAHEVRRTDSLENTELPTVNPPASALRYDIMPEDVDVMSRLEVYDKADPNAIALNLSGALAYAVAHSREYQFAEEDYVIAALRLLIERHRWGPRFFDEVSALAAAQGDGTTYDSSLNIVNDFSVTQRLPYGGEVAVRALASATEDLHQRVAGENVQDASIILSAEIPLLRGAGLAARDDRIQAERDLIYAAREFEDFRREFLFDIAVDFLDLVVQQMSINNAERQLESFEWLERRQREMVRGGRAAKFEELLASQDTLFARDRLSSLRESYRLSVDRFKVRIGMPESQPLVIALEMPELPPPQITPEEGVMQAFMYRLDLQTSTDQLDDARRGVLVARNALLPDLNLTGDAAFTTNPNLDRGGLQIDAERGAYTAGVRLGLPLDREIELLTARQSEIDLQRAIRADDELRDTVAVNVRSAIRDIDRARFSLKLQEENILIAERRRASIEAAPDRVDAREQSDALEEYLRALDDRDAAKRDLQVAILSYLLETGQMRVDATGNLRPISGMPELRSVPVESTTIQPYEEQVEEQGLPDPNAPAPELQEPIEAEPEEQLPGEPDEPPDQPEEAAIQASVQPQAGEFE